MDATAQQPATVSVSTWELVLMWGGLPVLGMAAGWLVKVLASWVSTLRWAPFKGPLELVASLPDPWATIGPLAVGGIAGLVIAFIGHQEYLTVTVSGESVMLRRGEKTRELAATAVDGVFVDGKQLVLLGEDTRELARERHDLAADRLREAFDAHGYTWHDADPYGDEFRPWVEASPDLSWSAHALLKARRRALEKDKKDDAMDLREELAKLGVIVREEKKRQYWRQVADR